MAGLVTAMGYEFVGYEFAQQNRRSIFRVYIDREGGVSHDDCKSVSHQVGAMLDVDGPIQGQYLLEVSSPGLDRPLFALAQYEKQLGKRVKLKLHMPVMQRRNFVGVLKRVEGDQIVLLLEDGNEVTLAFSAIEKANVIADISF
ncbi:MAG TPA: ribosome maturation factor RimP [Gammaproteobacteria bacterium]|nr:ribosome maturation factor RimP [Gammaproteobacteria bacterium]